MQQICFLTKQKSWWSDHRAIWALALVQRERGRQKTRCDGKLLIHLLIKGHFLFAIRGWRLGYLGLWLLFYLCLSLLQHFLRPSSCHSSSGCEKHQGFAVHAEETWPHCCWSVTCMCAAVCWACCSEGLYQASFDTFPVGNCKKHCERLTVTHSSSTTCLFLDQRP